MATEKGTRLKALLLVACVSLGAAALITGAWEVSHERILRNERLRLMANLSSVTSATAGAALVAHEIPSAELPESENVLQLFAMHESSRLIAWVYSSVAPSGYNGPIEFLIGLTPEGDIIRLRVMQHRETPGLGDAIEAEKSDWIRQFDTRNLRNTPDWALTIDGGEFDGLTGATITPRAMVAATGAILQYHATHAAALSDGLQDARPAQPSENP